MAESAKRKRLNSAFICAATRLLRCECGEVMYAWAKLIYKVVSGPETIPLILLNPRQNTLHQILWCSGKHPSQGRYLLDRILPFIPNSATNNKVPVSFCKGPMLLSPLDEGVPQCQWRWYAHSHLGVCSPTQQDWWGDQVVLFAICNERHRCRSTGDRLILMTPSRVPPSGVHQQLDVSHRNGPRSNNVRHYIGTGLACSF